MKLIAERELGAHTDVRKVSFVRRRRANCDVTLPRCSEDLKILSVRICLRDCHNTDDTARLRIDIDELDERQRRRRRPVVEVNKTRVEGLSEYANAVDHRQHLEPR